MKSKLCVLTPLFCILIAGLAHAGPNAGGALILALSEGTVYSPDIDYCDSATTPDCYGAVTRADGAVDEASAVVINVLATFPSESRLHRAYWGLVYSSNVVIVNHDHCGSFMNSGPSWPASSSGTVVTWDPPTTEALVPVYWFAAYAVGGPAEMYMAGWPFGGKFEDDSAPPIIDSITAYGVFGFGRDGTLICNVEGPSGACCFEDQHCEVLVLEVCGYNGGWPQGEDTVCEPGLCDQGACCLIHSDPQCVLLTESQCDGYGDYQGDGVPCEPNPCPTTGACCVEDGYTCTMMTPEECEAAGGLTHGPGVPCEPNPCSVRGACCYPDDRCELAEKRDCEAAGGIFQGEGTGCYPDTCRDPLGACCLLPDEVCILVVTAECAAQGGLYQGYDTWCEPNPCDDPMGACCFFDGTCAIRTEANCYDGIYEGDDTDCGPQSCGEFATGACCLPDGSCEVVTARTCFFADGTWMGRDSVCDPDPCVWGPCCLPDGTCEILTPKECEAQGGDYQGNFSDCVPCPDPTPIRDASWGVIKQLFR
jgi:hypothetical protein